jgi:hypothetical protein
VTQITVEETLRILGRMEDSRDELLAAAREIIAAAVTVSDGCAICGADLDGTPPHYSGCAVSILQAAITKAEAEVK